MQAIQSQLEHLPEYLSSHLLLSVTALGFGIGISLPLAVVVTRFRALSGPVLGAASVIQTIPSLALLALMVPLLREIGFLPAVIALTLYSMLPVIRNTVTGIEGVDPDLIEAGRALGMTPLQILFKIQLPLAMPVIIAGIRTATVWVIGIATLSTPVGATSLGNYIFSGLQTQNYTAVVIGCVAAATLALVLDVLIRLMEIASTRRSRSMFVTASAGCAVVVTIGLLPAVIPRGNADARPTVVIGAKTFTEQYILAAVIAEQLQAAGFHARSLDSLGSTVLFDALVTGQVDCYVDYSGTIRANHMKRDEQATAEVVLTEVTQWLRAEYDVECVGPLGFENAYALTLPRETAERLDIHTIDDLYSHAPQMTIAGDYEFFGRPEWAAVVAAYGFEFAREVSMDSALMYAAVDSGKVDVIAAFSTDGRIAAFDLVVLDDPRAALPPYDAVVLLGPEAQHVAGIRDALRPLLSSISAEVMRRANMLVDVEGQSVDTAARQLRSSIRASPAPVNDLPQQPDHADAMGVDAR